MYVSCDPASAVKNFLNLGRPESKQYQGSFFFPIRLVEHKSPTLTGELLVDDASLFGIAGLKVRSIRAPSQLIGGLHVADSFGGF